MSVLQMGTSATDKLFLEFIAPGTEIQLKENTKLYDRFKTDTKHVVGKYAIFKAMTASSKSARPSSSSTLPTAKQGTYDEFVIYMKRSMYATLQFDGLALACGKGEGAVMDIVKSEVKGQQIYIANKMNRQFWGDGSGRLAKLSAAISNSVTGYVDGGLGMFGVDTSDYTNPANYLEAGMSVDIRSSAGVLEAEDIEISAISDDGAGTATITFAEAVTATDNADLYDHDTYAASQAAGTGVPMGLQGIISTTDPYTGITETSFQNIDRDTYEWARANSLAMGGAATAISNAKILRIMQLTEQYGRVKAIITNDRIWNAYYQILEADKTMPNDPAFWGGLSGIKFYGGRSGSVPIVWDMDCPDQKMYFLDDEHLRVYAPTKNGMTYIPGDNGILTRVSGKDEFTAAMIWYNNFGTDKPQALGRLTLIKHATS